MSIRALTFPPKILGVPLSSTGTRLIMPDIEHWDGNDLISAEVGTVIYATLVNFAKTKMEIIELDASTLSVATTTGILINKRDLGFMGGTTAAAETAYDWTANETWVLLGSNPPQIYEGLVDLDEAQTITGLKTFTTANRPKLTTDANATADEQFVTKGELSRTALGTTTNESVIVAGTAGETVAAGEVLYLKAADGYWWKADASVITTADLVGLGVAQGAGTAAASITGGVLKFGRDTKNTGLTNGQKQYLSDTAGALSTSPGTVEVTLGYGLPDGTFFFKPKYDQQLTEDQQDALAGTSGTPSATNKYVTNDDTSATAAASKVVRSGAGSKIAEGYLQMTDAQATSLVGGIGTPITTLHAHKRTVITATYDTATATGSATYAHGLGVAPNWVKVHAIISGGNGTHAESVGEWITGGTNKCIYIGFHSATTQIDGNSDTACIYLMSAGDGDDTATGTVTVDATNITVSWTKTNGPSGTAHLIFESGV